MQAKELGLMDSINKLEQSKINLVSANNTTVIKKHIKFVLVLNQDIQETKAQVIDEVKQSQIQLSKQQKLSSQISQLENKANLLTSNADGNNAAIYYLEKAFSIIESAKRDLNDPSKDISTKIKQIQDLILKVEKLLQETT